MPLWWDDCDTVYCGFWSNYSPAAGYVSTLTLPSRWGLVLVGFLALFVKVSGENLFSTLCFIFHQIRASDQNQDDIYHQIQLILRNTQGEASTIWNLIRIGHAHKGSRFELYRRSFFLILVASVHSIGFWVAGGLSSRFVAGSDEAQAVPFRCGWMNETSVSRITDENFDIANALIVMGRYGYRRSASYAQACYGQTSRKSTSCSTYVHSTLPYTMDSSAPCPFDEAICNGPAIALDTGKIQSDMHLGVNIRADDGISIRKEMICVPLDAEKYTTGWRPMPEEQLSPLTPNASVITYSFGPLVNSTLGTNETYGITNVYQAFGDLPYNLFSVSSFIEYDGDQSLGFVPIDDLKSETADVTVIGLLNRIRYREPVQDAWFDAQNCTLLGNTSTLCTSTNALTFLGCKERYQFCTVDDRCTEFTGLYGTNPETHMIPDLNPTQRAVFRWYWKMMWASQLNFQIGLLGRESLVANEYLWDTGFNLRYSATLPSGHWHREVTNWMNTSLAGMQRATIAFSRPPEFDIGPGVSSLDHTSAVTDPDILKLCHRMKVRSQAHMSFSVLGLSLAIGLGAFLIILNLSLPTIVGYLQKKHPHSLHKRLEWIETSALQLQRMAAEGRGVGPWEGRQEAVPKLKEFGHLFNLTSQSLREGMGSTRDFHGGPMDGPIELQIMRDARIDGRTNDYAFRTEYEDSMRRRLLD